MTMTIDELADHVGVKLFDYQQHFLEALPALGQHPRVCLYYKTGAGKSLTALAAVTLLGYDTCVVVCPPSTHRQWKELGERLGVKIAPMSHALFRRKTTKLSRTVPIIADEFHLFGGQKGQGWRKLDKLAQHLQAPMILCSATPNYNDTERCYCVQHILDPHGTKGGYLQFIYQHCDTEQNPYGMEPIVTGFRNYPDAAAFLAAMPKVFYIPDDAQFTIQDITYSERLPTELTNVGYDRRSHRMVASLMEMRHTSRYQGLVSEDGGMYQDILDQLYVLFKQSPHVMVYANHATVANDLHSCLRQEGIDAAVVTGATPKAAKEKIIQQFRQGQHHVLIGTATLATGTDGLDRVCDMLVILDDTDDDALRRQLIGRILPRGDFVSSAGKQIIRMSPVL
jgi:superfamily II DNA or RNA helicase